MPEPRLTVEERLEQLEKLVEYAVVEGDWECPEGCSDPDADPDDGRLCMGCTGNGKDSVRVPTNHGHPELLAYLERYRWNW